MAQDFEVMMKQVLFSLLFLASVITARPQVADSLKLTLPEAEDILLTNNLSLLAEQLNIDLAEAEQIQAKVWPNPTLSIEQINPYISSYQKRHADEQASLFGSKDFGRYRQLEIQLEQVFSLAGKRKKQKAIAAVNADQAAAYLADFLGDLKTEFRKTIIDFVYYKRYIQLIQGELNSIRNIVQAYERQYREANVNKMELTRLRASEMNLKDEIIEAQNTFEDLRASLIVLLHLPDATELEFEGVFKADYAKRNFPFSLAYLQEQALEHRADIKISILEKKRAEEEYRLEKAERIPDLGVSVNYDRGGGIYPDYIGLGLSFDLPFTNSNKGNIKKAQLEIQQQKYLYEEHLLKVRADIRKKYNQMKHFATFLKDMDPGYEQDLDRMMTAYTTYFKKQNINITTYMDFLEAYIANKTSLFNNQRRYLHALEDLKYSTGTELE